MTILNPATAADAAEQMSIVSAATISVGKIRRAATEAVTLTVFAIIVVVRMMMMMVVVLVVVVVVVMMMVMRWWGLGRWRGRMVW